MVEVILTQKYMRVHITNESKISYMLSYVTRLESTYSFEIGHYIPTLAKFY